MARGKLNASKMLKRILSLSIEGATTIVNFVEVSVVELENILVGGRFPSTKNTCYVMV
jgi:hypothetical protein